LYATDVLRTGVENWEHRYTGDIGLFLALPTFNGQRFVGSFVVKNAPDFELPRDRDRDNVYEVNLEALSTDTGVEEVVATSRLRFNITNEISGTWEENGYRFLALPETREDYDADLNASLVSSDRQDSSQSDPVTLLGDLDGGGTRDLLLTVAQPRSLPFDNLGQFVPVAIVLSGEWVTAADGSVSDLSIMPEGESLTIFGRQAPSWAHPHTATVPDLDGDGAEDIIIFIAEPDLRADGGWGTFSGFFILSSTEIRRSLLSGARAIFLDSNIEGSPMVAAYVRFDPNSMEAFEFENRSVPIKLKSIENASVENFDIILSQESYAVIFDSQMLSDYLSAGGNYLFSELLSQAVTIRNLRDQSGALTAEWFERPYPVGDLNADGFVDFAFLGSSYVPQNPFADLPLSVFILSGRHLALIETNEVSLAELLTNGSAHGLQIGPRRRNFGRVILGLGDADSDGFADIFIGSSGDTSLIQNGVSVQESFPSHVVYGSASFFDGELETAVDDLMTRGQAIEINGVMLPGEAGDHCGETLHGVSTTAGDLDGDENSELIIVRRSECGLIKREVRVIGSARLAERSSLDIENKADTVASVRLGEDFDMLFEIGAFKQNEGPIG
jgi:hypothetical protein